MKLTDIIQPEKIVLERQNEIKKGIKRIGRVKLHKGQYIWQLNTKTFLIEQIIISDATVDIKGGIHKKFVVKEDCIYAIAINKTNAERKFLKALP